MAMTQFLSGVSNLWNGLWNGLMEWTDGMEYQLIKIAKTHYCGRSKVVSTVLPLLASTGLLCLTSAFYPCTQAHARNVLHVDKAMFGMDNIIRGSGSVDVR